MNIDGTMEKDVADVAKEYIVARYIKVADSAFARAIELQGKASSLDMDVCGTFNRPMGFQDPVCKWKPDHQERARQILSELSKLHRDIYNEYGKLRRMAERLVVMPERAF